MGLAGSCMQDDSTDQDTVKVSKRHPHSTSRKSLMKGSPHSHHDPKRAPSFEELPENSKTIRVEPLPEQSSNGDRTSMSSADRDYIRSLFMRGQSAPDVTIISSHLKKNTVTERESRQPVIAEEEDEVKLPPKKRFERRRSSADHTAELEEEEEGLERDKDEDDELPLDQPKIARSNTLETYKAKFSKNKKGQRMVNQYAILKQLGSGSYGKVSLVSDLFGKYYAMKIINKAMLRRQAGFGKGNSLDSVKSEIAIMKKLCHPNIVKLFEVIDDEDNDKLFMVMEYVEKGSVMKGEVNLKPLDPNIARKYFRQVVQGFSYLHGLNIIHRDIKPENLLVSKDDVIKIADFGLSKLFSPGTDGCNNTDGTPAFLAPEVCLGTVDVSSTRTDIWALGVTLYQFIFGKLPFVGRTVFVLYQMIPTQEVTFPEDVEVDEDVKHLITRLLDKDPETRITLEEIARHPWVDQKGQDPLILEEMKMKIKPTPSELFSALTRRVVAVVKLKSKMRSLRSRLRERRDSSGSLGPPSRSSSLASSPSSARVRNFSEDPVNISSNPSPSSSPAHHDLYRSTPLVSPMILGRPMEIPSLPRAFRKLDLREDSPNDSQGSHIFEASESSPMMLSTGMSSSIDKTDISPPSGPSTSTSSSILDLSLRQLEMRRSQTEPPEYAPGSSNHNNNDNSTTREPMSRSSSEMEVPFSFPRITIDRVPLDVNRITNHDSNDEINESDNFTNNGHRLGIVITSPSPVHTPNHSEMGDRDRSVSFSSHMSVPSRETSRRPSEDTFSNLTVPGDDTTSCSLSRSSSRGSDMVSSTPGGPPSNLDVSEIDSAKSNSFRMSTFSTLSSTPSSSSASSTSSEN